MIKVVLFIVSIALILLGLFIFMQKESPLPSLSHEVIEKVALPQQASLPIKTNVQSHISEKSYHIEQKGTLDNPLSQTLEVYETLSLEEALLFHKPRSYVKAISAIRIPNKNIKKGDTLILPNIEGVDYSILISHVDKNHDGSRSITGSYTDEDIPYTTTMTQSSTNTFISLATPQGSYEIETFQEIGYIYKSNEIRQYMQPKAINDGIILPPPSTSHPEE
jgi:hypothetical protein